MILQTSVFADKITKTQPFKEHKRTGKEEQQLCSFHYIPQDVGLVRLLQNFHYQEVDWSDDLLTLLKVFNPRIQH